MVDSSDESSALVTSLRGTLQTEGFNGDEQKSTYIQQ